ncbi:MAG: ATP-binding cassette domain-containing protein [Candidatus Diapherotrites archaeon]|uniref:ATP-binding cassette domain-containing protein n=1 Tax=Candidatus Iainarchaeum sp. TaxID=3101447 RepID=A0A939C9B1_9ARCH|nr:ATP-binding cassette domain-containing protein [Candidatus Diapherotrites archaeon]
MNCLEVEEVIKSYEDVDAVKGLSFDVKDGELFGILGPNGAGKTTTIRMLLDIIKPDKGRIRILGRDFCEDLKRDVGYLPEERGLYEGLTVMQNLLYLASLKGMKERDARANALNFLKRVELLEFADKRVGMLSKGMKQLVQLIATLVHEPKLLILDEPFSGLDPANRELVKKIILLEKEKKRTIILSTHMMNEVEELCDRVLMVNLGRRVLYGSLDDIKDRYAQNCVFVEFTGAMPKLEGVEKANIKKNNAELYLRVDTSPQMLLKEMVQKNVNIRRFDVREMSLNQIFIKLVEAEKWIKL